MMKRGFFLILFFCMLTSFSTATVELSVSSSSVNIGDVIELNFTVESKKTVTVPNLKPSVVPHFRILFSDVQSLQNGKTNISIKLVPLKVGTFESIFEDMVYGRIPYFSIQVESLLSDNMTDIAHIKGLQEWAPQRSLLPVWIGVSVLILSLLALGIWLKFRKPKTEVIYVETAAERFDKFQKMESVDAGIVMAELSIIVRLWLGEVKVKRYLESTTEEVLNDISTRDDYETVATLLLAADRVKFAGGVITENELNEYIDSVSTLLTVAEVVN